MPKALVILTTAFNPSHLHHTAFGELRVLQYCLGLARVTELLKRNGEYDAIIVDNTITPEWQMPPQLQAVVAAMPRTQKLFFADNELGSKNKGSGCVIDWRAAASATHSFKDYSHVIHFEPRLILLDFSFFDRFERQPGNYILFESFRRHSTNKIKDVALAIMRRAGHQCWTGLFSIDREHFLKLIQAIDIQEMTQKNISLEQVFYVQARHIFKNSGRLGVLWHDGFTNTYSVY